MTAQWWSLLIQASGSAATVLASVWVAYTFGLAAQGEYALLRSWSDALVALLTFGLPQGLMHLQYREGVATAALQRVVWWATAAVAAAALCFVLLWHLLPLNANWPWTTAAFMAAAMPLWVAHRLWRALALHGLGVLPYAVLTSVPTWSILAGVLAMAGLGVTQGFDRVLFMAALLSALAGLLALRAWQVKADRFATPTMWRISTQTLGQTLLAAAFPAALLGLARWMGAGLEDVGVLSLGLLVYELFAVLAAYLAPSLYDRAARLAPAHGARPLAAWVRRWGLPFLLAALMSALLVPWALGHVRPGLRGHEWATTAMALAGLFALCARLWATTLQAQGRMAELSLQAAGRLVAGLGTMALLFQPLGILVAAPTALMTMELLTLWRLWAVRREVAK